MEEKLSGIVLGGVAYGEADRIQNVFTLEKGVISAKIKGVKKAGAKLKFASEPFCFAEFVFSTRLDKRTVIGASLIDSFYPLREDIYKYFAGGTILELVKKFYRENIVSERGFLSTVNALKELSYGDGDVICTLIRYIVTILEEAGYTLGVSPLCECGEEIDGRTYFDYRTGSFFCEKCFNGTGREINNDTLKALLKVMDGQDLLKDMSVRVLKLLEYYIENRVEESVGSLKELIKIL